MSYAVKEIFFTLQGEGRQAGRPAVFCRFAGCNLWTGREEDRATAVCTFCDTDFVGTDGPDGGKFATAEELADKIFEAWPDDHESDGHYYVVCTGGEPTLQMDEELIDALHERGFEIAIETNGTRPVPDGIDWICVSPKANAPLVQLSGDELKLVYPQATAMPERFADLDFEYKLLQPMDGPDQAANTAAAVAYCLEHPRWGLSLQTHKFLGLR
ncbi:MAG: 7-carboxy-7-deazaguanine synthase [Gemmatimonadota bacterium]